MTEFALCCKETLSSTGEKWPEKNRKIAVDKNFEILK